MKLDKKGKRYLVASILIVIIVCSFFVVFKVITDKKEDELPVERYEPNDVMIKEFDYSLLKIEQIIFSLFVSNKRPAVGDDRSVSY